MAFQTADAFQLNAFQSTVPTFTRVSVDIQVILDGSADTWTSLGTDVVTASDITISRGIDGHGPLDLVASPGEAAFTLRNDSRNAAGIQGWYSPEHVLCRIGWGKGIPVRIQLTHRSRTQTIFRGRIGQIMPEAGRYRNRRVRVVCYDHMDDLMRTELRELALGVTQTDTQLFQAIIDGLPIDFRPPAIALDTAYDTFPIAFDDLGFGVKALSAMRGVAISASALVFASANGTLTTQNRGTRAAATSEVAFTDDEMTGLDVVTGADDAFTRARVQTHPKTVGSAPVVLYQETAIIPVFPGQTISFQVAYQDPNDVRTLIGGLDIIVPVATTDYEGNALADGSGSDLTGDLVITATDGGSSSFVAIENTGAQDVYLVNGSGQPFFRIRGTPVYNDGERLYEAEAANPAGNNTLTVDLPYQASPTVGQAFADYYLSEYQDPTPIQSVEAFAATVPIAEAVLDLEIGDRMTLTETVTGVDVDVVIQGVDITIRAGG